MTQPGLRKPAFQTKCKWVGRPAAKTAASPVVRRFPRGKMTPAPEFQKIMGKLNVKFLNVYVNVSRID